MPRRMDRRPTVRTPLAMVRWMFGEVWSLVVSGFVAIVVSAILSAGLLAALDYFGAKEKPFPQWHPALIFVVIPLAALDVTNRAMRDLTRPPPLPPPVEIRSGRASPLWDRDLDG